MVLIDKDSLFKRDLIEVLEQLQVNYHVVAPEQHEAILCERFHRFLNKVQRIQGLDINDHSKWMMNILLATYAWDASPIDGANLVRSFVAKAREFRLPLDVVDEPKRIIHNAADQSIIHHDTMFPLQTEGTVENLGRSEQRKA
jgi:predicted protein tyrosine phosphatase